MGCFAANFGRPCLRCWISSRGRTATSRLLRVRQPRRVGVRRRLSPVHQSPNDPREILTSTLLQTMGYAYMLRKKQSCSPAPPQLSLQHPRTLSRRVEDRGSLRPVGAAKPLAQRLIQYDHQTDDGRVPSSLLPPRHLASSPRWLNRASELPPCDISGQGYHVEQRHLIASHTLIIPA